MKRTYYREINGHNFSRFLDGDEAIYFVDNQRVVRGAFTRLAILHMIQEMERV